MNQHYQQLDLQSLFDLLAAETEKHTRAFISGQSLEVAYHRANINALIAEIKQRRQENLLTPELKLDIPPDAVADATPPVTE